MATYRVYRVSNSGEMKLVQELSAANDEKAIELAREFHSAARKCEIWEGSRLVAEIGSRDLG
jgi:hypothetical protein